MNLTIEQIIIFLGVIVFLVNIVVEITKNIEPLNQMHTNYYVVILSITFTLIGYFAYISWAELPFIWYYFVGSIFLGLIAAYLAMFGWEKLIRLWNVSQKNK